jgi:hypothetical protein
MLVQRRTVFHAPYTTTARIAILSRKPMRPFAVRAPSGQARYISTP